MLNNNQLFITRLSQNMNQNSKAMLVSSSTKAAHTFRHSIEHIDHSIISNIRKLKHVYLICFSMRPLYTSMYH